MKTLKFLTAVCFTAISLGASSCTPTQSVRVSSLSPDQILASCVHNQVNAYRKSKGSAALSGHPGLNKLALQHSEYMRKNRGTFGLYGKNVTHMGSEGRALAAMRIYNFINSSENVAAAMKGASNSQSAATLVKLWTNSPEHEAEMKASSYTHTGIGIVTDADGTMFATQIFGTLTQNQLATRERFNSF